MKDNFSGQAEGYARYRPNYPPELFEFILEHVKGREVAWDCATGNGQTALELAKSFDKVLATDISQQQLERAERRDNIFYSLQPAEETTFTDSSIDLITVSQALHWFRFEAFYSEVKRVAKPGSWISVWMYSLLHIGTDIDKVIRKYYSETLHGYWDSERKHVDEAYSTIPFPFEEISCPSFRMRFDWTLEEFEGYLNTWSAVQKFISLNEYSPVPAVMEQIKPLWQGDKMNIDFPITMRMGRIVK